MSEDKFLSVFTPSQTDPNDLEAIFVQREDLLQDAVDRVIESAETGHKHHLLFSGPRGCGKTNLVTLLVHRLSKNESIADKLLIAWLNEDDTFTILLDVLLKCHEALVKRYPQKFQSDQIEQIFGEKPEIAEKLLKSILLDLIKGRTLLILVENLDAVFEGLGDKGQKSLRALIQEHPRFCIVATAQKISPDISSREKPFYGFFQIDYLQPLSVFEATRLLEKIAKHNNRNDVAHFLATSKGRTRVRALHHLAGGNHRIYIVLSQFISRNTVDALVGPFVKMVDELTPYYQERVRWLPAGQRRIVEFLCESATTVTVSEISKRLFSTSQTISKQLQDLREKGYVVSNKRGRESYYEISEPLMRICVEVKENQSNEPLKLLVDFLRIWYEDENLENQKNRVDTSSLEYKYVSNALQKNSEEGSLRQKFLIQDIECRMGSNHDICSILDEAPEVVVQGFQCLLEGENREAHDLLTKALAKFSDSESQAAILHCRSHYFRLTNIPEKAIEDLSTVIELQGVRTSLFAMSLLDRAAVFYEIGGYENAIADYSSVIELKVASVEQQAKALVCRGFTYDKNGESEKAVADFTSVVELKAAPIKELVTALNDRGVTHSSNGDFDKAIADYTSIVELEDAPVEQLAMAHNNRGTLFLKKGELSAAHLDLKSALSLFDGDPKDGIFFISLGEILFAEGKWAEGLASLEKGVERGFECGTEEIVNQLFQSALSPKVRTEKIKATLEVFEKYQQANRLGEGLIRHLGFLYQSDDQLPANDNLEQWALAWEDCGKMSLQFRIPLRIFRVGIEFVKSGGDEGTLLDLISTERNLLRQALGLGEE